MVASCRRCAASRNRPAPPALPLPPRTPAHRRRTPRRLRRFVCSATTTDHTTCASSSEATSIMPPMITTRRGVNCPPSRSTAHCWCSSHGRIISLLRQAEYGAWLRICLATLRTCSSVIDRHHRRDYPVATAAGAPARCSTRWAITKCSMNRIPGTMNNSVASRTQTTTATRSRPPQTTVILQPQPSWPHGGAEHRQREAAWRS